MPDPMNAVENYNQYIGNHFAVEDEALKRTREAMAAGGLPSIEVSASEGKLLHLLARMCNARRILEIGSLGGYSAIWLARALPAGGQLISLELDPHHAQVAGRNVANAGLSQLVEIQVGPALENLVRMSNAGTEPFDLVFIDADKEGYVDYLNHAVRLVRPGGWILADNTLPPSVLEPAADSGAKRYNTALSAHPELVSIIIPILRDRGFDGLSISQKKA